MKKICILLVSFFVLFLAFAAEKPLDPYKDLFRNAQVSFNNADYGKALSYGEEAILSRKVQITKEINEIENATKPVQVQRVGDKITEVRKILLEREEYDSVNLINFYLKKKGDDFFDNSISKLISYLKSITVYPEAQKLIGDIYKVEGEYSFAENYYLEALKNASVLDIPDEKYEILYLLAEISSLQHDDEKLEIRLLNVLVDDGNYHDNTKLRSIKTLVLSNKDDSMEKLFRLYRCDGYNMLEAYSQLADFYSKKGDLDRAMTFACLHSVTGFTKIITILEKRNVDFTYSGLESLFEEASHYDDIVEWGNEKEVWKSFNFLSELAKRKGANIFAEDLLTVVSKSSPVEYYRKEAVIQLGY